MVEYHNAQPEPPLVGTTHYFNSGFYCKGIIEGYTEKKALVRVSDGVVEVNIEDLNTKEPGQYATSEPGHGRNSLTDLRMWEEDINRNSF